MIIIVYARESKVMRTNQSLADVKRYYIILM